MRSWDDLINKAVDDFNFVKVRKAMKALDWVWERDGVRSVPKKRELRSAAINLLQGVIKDVDRATGSGEATHSSGGFLAQAWHEFGHRVVHLSFEVTSSETGSGPDYD